MIRNDDQLEATVTRIAHLVKVQAGIRKTATPRQFESMSAGYLSEIKRMCQELVEYLSCQENGCGEEACSGEVEAQTRRVG